MQTHSDTDSVTDVAGRFGRRSWLAWNIVIGLIMMVILVIMALLMPFYHPHSSPEGFIPILILGTFAILILVAIYFCMIFAIRRLHDCDHNGWLVLLHFIPILNILFIFYLTFAPGNKDKNLYGMPRTTLRWESILSILYSLLFVFVLIVAVIIPKIQTI